MSSDIEMDLEDKVLLTKMRIQQWYEHWDGQVYVAFSGGKDSTVLLHLVREMYPEVKGVFSNTGLEYPEIVKFVKTFENIETIRPKKNFVKVLKEDGFPITNKKTAGKLRFLSFPNKRNFKSRRLALTGFASDRNEFNHRSKLSKKWSHLIGSDLSVTNRCCDHLKKNPINFWIKKRKIDGLPILYPYVGMMMGEGTSRDSNLNARLCNVYKSKQPTSNPMKYWNTKDVWEYIKIYHIKICSVYKDFNVNRTGCTFCAYGAEFEKGESRFEKLKKSHPVQFNAFIHKFGMNKALDYAKIPYGEEPTHTPPECSNYECCSCHNEFPIYKVAFATERDWTEMEELTSPPTAGMNLYCRVCALKNNLPVSSKE